MLVFNYVGSGFFPLLPFRANFFLREYLAEGRRIILFKGACKDSCTRPRVRKQFLLSFWAAVPLRSHGSAT